ncbi:cytochrome b/b6 domain-containing protein [Parahaliea mediterranea]|uniref:Cytochrome b/b6 domain-containing protein n=1 Tax=Parahaliea mediterranea TaxID=651086 RepID=A0A939IN33_9GAMM|nr:cytochrome b/b6 domain-containing protein [Parahaliea mediterranea]MBN7798150.1 cytochrome b/b6 domain-containing protein [Parahaliea mediterranea]
MSSKRYPLWDWPTRLFHWILVLAIPLAWWTGEEGLTDWHERLGYTVLVLVLFRLAWGFWGSRASRFGAFLRGPRAVAGFVRDGLRDRDGAASGHNPLGGWFVVVALALLLLQVVSGLFNSDDILFDGPLHHLASGAWQDRFGAVHEVAFNALLGLVALHILAVAWHQWARGEKLVQAMVKGSVAGREGAAPPAPAWRALCFLALAGAGLWLLLELVPAPVSPW